MIYRLCLVVLVVFLVTTLVILAYATAVKTIPPKWDYGSTVYYRGLGITNDSNSWLGKRDVRIEWTTIDGLFYKATSNDGVLFRFQITSDGHVLAEGTTRQDDFNPNMDYGVPFVVDHGVPYEATSLLASTNYDLNGAIICKVRNGDGQFLLPRQSDVFKDRLCGLYEIEKSTARKVCFLNKRMQDIDKEDLTQCVTWSH